MSAVIDKIEGILTDGYSVSNYVALVNEVFDSLKIVAPTYMRRDFPTNFAAHIVGYSHIGDYRSPDGKRIVVFSVELKKQLYVENSRSTQRSLAKKLIESANADAALVAFYTPGDPRWRLSFVRLDYEIKIENGKLKAAENITPAKRYSFLVGKDEPCHTAIERFRLILDKHNAFPTLDDLENAFSVEAVTKEFFELYCEKYHQLREALEKNEDFIEEAKLHNFTSAQFAKKLMGQIVFLYFLQKKGWLGVKAWPRQLNAADYKKAFYSRGVKSRELIPAVYTQTDIDTYRINATALNELSAEDETFLSTCVRGEPWGTGPHNFMRRLFDASEKRGANFFDDYLEPLFYNALNVNRGEQGYDPALHCRIPFLSGGLFEPIDGYDWEHNRFAIPNELFSNKKDNKDRLADGILDIFDRYNFTMSEDEPLEREVAIDPEMLGKVFENLLDINDRKSKGAFYTPREIVHYMCQESLINYLTNKMQVGEMAIRDFILYGDFMKDEDAGVLRRAERGDSFDLWISEELYQLNPDGTIKVDRIEELDKALQDVRVADPAVGSGAFPLGMLNEIVRARQNLTTYMDISLKIRDPFGANREIRYRRINERSARQLKYETIRNCIFAVDIEPSAVDIAQLRLWLALVIDDEVDPNALTALEGHRNPLPLPNLECNILCGNSLVDEFEGIRLINQSNIIGTAGAGMQTNLYQSAFEATLKRLIEKQDELFACDNTEKKNQILQDIDALRDTVILSQLQNVSQETIERYYAAKTMASKPFVLWQLDFARVFREKGGFDIIIGNPPYGAKFERKDKKLLDRLYAGCCVPDYESADFFIELANTLIRNEGVLSYIVPNMFMANVFAKKYREHLITNWDILAVDNLSDINVFESATVRNCIVFFVKSKIHHLAKFTKTTIIGPKVSAIKSTELSDQGLSDNIDNWLNLIEKDERALSITTKMESGSIPLGDLAEISQGLIPYDKYRGHTPEMIKNKIWNANYQKDESFRKELRGKDVGRYTLKWNGIDWISYGDWLAAPRKPAFFQTNRILIREITNPRILSTITEEEYYNTPSIINCINVSVDIYYVLGILNSSLMSFYHNMISPKASKGLFPKILVNDVRKMPIKIGNKQVVDGITQNVKILLSDPTQTDSDRIIDELVYQTYGITDEEQTYILDWFANKVERND